MQPALFIVFQDRYFITLNSGLPAGSHRHGWKASRMLQKKHKQNSALYAKNEPQLRITAIANDSGLLPQRGFAAACP
jgi:hypothetical protein